MVIQSINGIYMHCAWGTSANGADFSLTEFADATYRGIYYDRSPAESMDPISYKWILIDSIDGDATEDDAIEAENAAALANAQAEQANSQTIVNNDNLQATQYSTDDKVGNPNELVGTNQGTNGWTASADLTISAVTDTIYNPTDDPVNYLHVVCDSAGSNYIYFDAQALRGKLSEFTDDNAFTFSADLRMSTVFALSVAVQNVDGTDQQIDFGTIDTELIPVPEETADGLWNFNKLTADMVGGVAESSQVLYIDLSNMGAGDTLDVANLKVEGGALATPWRASLDEVAAIANQAYQVAGNTQQHFWFTSTGADTGAHITEKTQDDFLQDPTNGGGNLLARSNGIAIRDGMRELATLTANGQTFNNENDVPVFGIGISGQTQYPYKVEWFAYNNESPFTCTLDWQANAVQLVYGYDDVLGTQVCQITSGVTAAGRVVTLDAAACATLTASGAAYVQIQYRAIGDFPCYTLGTRQGARGNFSTSIGENNKASGDTATAIGESNKAEGTNATAIGRECKAGLNSLACGLGTDASWHNQLACGQYNVVAVSDDLFMVGSGYDANNRATIFKVSRLASEGVQVNTNLFANNNLYIGNNIVADHVIERGTSGNWKYIKWASGRVECEGYYTFASLSFSTSGNMYRSVSNAFTIPSGIFTTAPTEGMAWIQGSNTVYPSATIGGLTTTGGNCQIWKSTSGSATNVSVHMRIVYR